MVSIEVEKIEIEKYLKKLEDAELRKDLDAVLELLTEDCIYIRNSKPHIQGRVAWKEFYEELFKTRIAIHSGSITSLGIEISSSGDMAWNHGVFFTEFESPDGYTKAGGKSLTVYRKVDGKWKTVAVCTTGSG